MTNRSGNIIVASLDKVPLSLTLSRTIELFDLEGLEGRFKGHTPLKKPNTPAMNRDTCSSIGCLKPCPG